MKQARPETEQITLEVRLSNIAAIKLYEKHGFRETGRRTNYYSNPNEDGIIMGLDLAPDTTARDSVNWDRLPKGSFEYLEMRQF